MRVDLLMVALCVGAFTWAFRYLPTRWDVSGIAPGGLLGRFLASTGPAAIATLFVASGLPLLDAKVEPVIAGTLAVLAVFFWRKSVVAATLAGSFAYGAVFWALSQGA